MVRYGDGFDHPLCGAWAPDDYTYDLPKVTCEKCRAIVPLKDISEPSLEPGRVERGIYRHFKGNIYFVFGEVLGVEGEETKRLVLYEALYGKPGRMFVRSVENFVEPLDKPEYNYKGPRFAPVER
jgi:hypothetical protein